MNRKDYIIILAPMLIMFSLLIEFAGFFGYSALPISYKSFLFNLRLFGWGWLCSLALSSFALIKMILWKTDSKGFKVFIICIALFSILIAIVWFLLFYTIASLRV